MKKILFLALIAFSFAFAKDDSKEQSKMILGKWVNPYTYQSEGELRGFECKKKGVCKGINLKAADFQKWAIENGKLVIMGESISKDGSKSEYRTAERIDRLTKDSLVVVYKESAPRLVFVYVRPEFAKKHFAPGSERK